MNVGRLRSGDEILAADVLNAVKPLEERGGNTADAALMKGFLAVDSNYLVVAHEDDGTPLGFALGYLLPRVDRHKNMMYLHEVAVVPNRRGQGIGKAIMTEMVRVCRDEGFMEMFVITDKGNPRAMRLYSSTGGLVEDDGALIFCWDF